MKTEPSGESGTATFSPDQLTLAPEALFFAASVAQARIFRSLAGFALGWFCPCCEAPVRHAILFTPLRVVLTHEVAQIVRRD